MGSEAAICRIIECEGAAIGYAHALEIGLLGDERPADLAAGTWHVNVLIASPAASRPRPGRRGAHPAHRGGVCDHAGRGVRGRRVDQERGWRAGLRAGGLSLAADRARPPARPFLADAEGAAALASARSPSWPAATSRRDTVSVPSPAISSSMALTRPSRSPCRASQASGSPASRARIASRVKAAWAAASWLSACATARRS